MQLRLSPVRKNWTKEPLSRRRQEGGEVPPQAARAAVQTCSQPAMNSKSMPALCEPVREHLSALCGFVSALFPLVGCKVAGLILTREEGVWTKAAKSG